MNRIQLIFIIAISLISCEQSQTSKSQTGESEKMVKEEGEWETLNEDKYEIKYPSNWVVDTSGQMGLSFFLFSPLSNESDNFKENVNLLVQDLAGHDLNLHQYVEISEGQIQNFVTDGNIILSERKKNAQTEYHKLIYTGKQGIFNLKFEQLFWVIENKAYVLTLTCKDNEFENFQEIGERILKSFRVKN